jgi:4-amino-4-deoxy-L-arabinose transferase-like glycosyltransferase
LRGYSVNGTKQSEEISLVRQIDELRMWIPIFGLAAIFIWRIIITVSVNLIPDECSYWTWSRRLDWSYFDNSGMVAYLIRLSTEFFGRSTPFTVRFPFLLISIIFTFLIYSTGTRLSGSRRIGLLSALFFNLTPISLLGGSSAVHDNPLLLFWALSLWSVSKFVRTENHKYFYLAGLSAGLAILSKYTGALLLPVILLWLLSSNRFRSSLARKEPWIGALVATVFVLPILWWNFSHDWASFKHILFIGTGYSGFWRKISDGLGYQLAQILIISPLFFVSVVASIFVATLAELRRDNDERSLLLCFGFPLFLLAVMSFRGHAEANWGVMGYVSTGILTIMIFSDPHNALSRLFHSYLSMRKFVIAGACTSILLVLIVVLHAWIGLLPASVERNLGKNDRIVWETRGWRGLGKYLATVMEEGDVLASDSYQNCALLEFNIPGQPSVRYLSPWDRPTQFDVWHRSYDDLKGKNILFVSSKPLKPSSSVLMTIYENFSSVEPIPAYDVMYHGESIRKIYIYRGHNFDPFEPRRLGPRSLFYSGL